MGYEEDFRATDRYEKFFLRDNLDNDELLSSQDFDSLGVDFRSVHYCGFRERCCCGFWFKMISTTTNFLQIYPLSLLPPSSLATSTQVRRTEISRHKPSSEDH